METSHTEEINVHTLMYQVFGSTRAEWLGEQLYELFAEPRYFPELQTNRPCFLVGGRGTGKTSALKGLSYEGQAALKPSSDPKEWGYFGFYHRVDTNRVTAFRGEELTEDRWSRLFGHYINLVLSLSVVAFTEWFERVTHSRVSISKEELELVAHSLGIQGPVLDLRSLGTRMRMALVDFEAAVNNIADGSPPVLSMLGAPIELLMGSLKKLPQFEGKIFFFLLDEYENYLEYQQRVVNTLVKHAGNDYTFKVGVRQLGWKVHTTLNDDAQLMYPADYALIDVEDRLKGDHFKAFATQVCQGRLDLLARRLGTDSISVKELLPGLSEDEEARLLGVASHIKIIRDELNSADEALDEFDRMSELQAYFLLFWSKSQRSSIISEFRSFKSDPFRWQTRFQNYKHALLYTLHKGRRGVRKYYSGWDTFLLVSGSNIRYTLELVYECLKLTFEQGHELEPVSAYMQTAAAQSVGTRALKELEGVSIYGAQLTKLVLGLGRVFSVMASEAEGHAPEVNQFYFYPTPSAPSSRQQGLIDAAVMHLALIRRPATKLDNQAATQEYDYWLHPVFAPFFEFSHRKKRKMRLDFELVEGLVDRPRTIIRHILSSTGRSVEGELPEQLQMFEGYYGTS